jgi:phage I-like protein
MNSPRFEIPADGWVQIAPYAEILAPLSRPGAEPVPVMQVMDRATAERIATRFRDEAAAQANFPGLLVDFDHFSHDEDKSTRAAGWIDQVEAREAGLFAHVRFSASGQAALEGGDYRLFSPVLAFEAREYRPGERVRPMALLRGALTNDPRFKGMIPLANRAATFPTQTTMDYKAKLLQLLGLPETSDDAAIEAALAPATENMAAGKKYPETANRLTALEAQLVESDLDKAGLQGEARAAAKVVLTKNRDEGLAFLAALAKPGSGYQVTHNRGAARLPSADKKTGDKSAERDAAVSAYRTANRCDFTTAWNAVRAAKPDLFAE